MGYIRVLVKDLSIQLNCIFLDRYCNIRWANLKKSINLISFKLYHNRSIFFGSSNNNPNIEYITIFTMDVIVPPTHKLLLGNISYTTHNPRIFEIKVSGVKTNGNNIMAIIKICIILRIFII